MWNLGAESCSLDDTIDENDQAKEREKTDDDYKKRFRFFGNGALFAQVVCMHTPMLIAHLALLLLPDIRSFIALSPSPLVMRSCKHEFTFLLTMLRGFCHSLFEQFNIRQQDPVDPLRVTDRNAVLQYFTRGSPLCTHSLHFHDIVVRTIRRRVHVLHLHMIIFT